MEANYFTILYWLCHTSTWICHRCTRVPHPDPPSHLPPHTIPLGHPSAPAPSILYHASNLDWRFVSYMVLYMFQCHSPKASFLGVLGRRVKVFSVFTLETIVSFSLCCTVLVKNKLKSKPRLKAVEESARINNRRYDLSVEMSYYTGYEWN